MIRMEEAYVLISCDIGKEDHISKYLSGKSYVKENKITFGSYDVIAKIEAAGMPELGLIIKNKIETIDGVRSTLTLPTKKIYENK